MPNFLIRETRVLRLMPIRAAAPVAPPTRPLLSVSARSISSRCLLAQLSVTLLFCLRASTAFFRNRARPSGSCSAAPCVGWSVFDLCSSSSGASKDLLRVTITARSNKVLQLTDIARPVPSRKPLHDGRRNSFNLLLHLLGKLLDKVTHQLSTQSTLPWMAAATIPNSTPPTMTKYLNITRTSCEILTCSSMGVKPIN